jgi:MFS superfamily sulfate permease-like transporter
VVGTITGAFFTSSAFMAVQATGAMSMVVADVPAVHDASDPARALFTLSVLTGVVMLAAGLLRLGSVLRFVSNAVMVGFLSAVGVNIVLRQLANFTGYQAQGPTVSSAPSTPSCTLDSSTSRPSPSASPRSPDPPARADQARSPGAGGRDRRRLGRRGRARMGRRRHPRRPRRHPALPAPARSPDAPAGPAAGGARAVPGVHLLHVVRQSNQISIKRRRIDPQGQFIETDPPARLPAEDVVIPQPYGSLFFAAAPVFEAALPALGEDSRNSVVILRLRGRSDLGTTFMDVLYRYAQGLAALGSKLVIVSVDERIQEQLAVTGITDLIGAENLYTGDERVGATVRRANADAMAWVEANRRASGSDPH